MDVLQRIKRLVIRGRVRLSKKARWEMLLDGLTADDLVESIVNAQAVTKVLRSQSPMRSSRHEKLYVIKSFNYSGTLIYTKGKFGREEGEEVFYVFISAKINTIEED